MTNTKLVCFMALSVAIALAAQLAAQVQTVVPPVVAGAKPVTVEHIKVHGTALEGNLEGDAIDREVIYFCRRATPKKSPAAIRSSMRCMVIPSAPSNGAVKSMCRKPSKALLPRVLMR